MNSKTTYSDSCFDPKHADTARHFTMLSALDEPCSALPIRTALTVGDDRGRDAHYLKRLGIKSVASDLDTNKIKAAKESGFIDEFAKIDAEQITYPDDHFDIVLCKESFHHFPRPWLCLYEMLRVAKRFVAVIEPLDNWRPVDGVRFPGPECYSDYYERAMNYQYRVSVREFLKVAWSLHLPCVSVFGFNDPYKLPLDLAAWKAEKDRLDLLGIEGSRQFNLASIVIYKEPPDVSSFSSRHIIYYRPSSPFEG